METWDLYTKYREKTGKTQIRVPGEEIPEGYYHLVVHVWIRNSKGEYLISQRAANRPTNPLMWECVGGSVLKDESSLEGALRETKEEVGIDLNSEHGNILFSKIRETVDGCPFRDILDVWLFEYDGEVSLEQSTTEEVAQCQWMSVEEIRKLWDENKFVPTLDYFFVAFHEEQPDYSHIIGMHVSGKVDRPLGTVHPRHSDLVYQINYGYVEGITGGDGEEQDVYIVGTDKPINEFDGKVIGVYHRFDDIEDKWIVSLGDYDITPEKILGDIAFQEQFFYGKLYLM